MKKPYPKSVHRAGFEPASPKREQLKCSALDHSAIDAIMILPAGLEPAALRLPCRRLSTHKSLMLCQTELRELCSMGSLCPKAPNWGFLSFQSVSLSFQSVNRLSELSSKFNFFPVQQKPYSSWNLLRFLRKIISFQVNKFNRG